MASAIDPPATADGSGEEPQQKPKVKMADRIEAFVSRLSTRNNFWHRLCSMIWLPYAFRSGIRMKRVDEQTFSAILPFKKFNRNWYNAMAGAALLGNAEIAGGTYVFGACGGDFTVVCRKMEYRFLRPCFGPAIYRIEPKEDLEALVEKGEEFNITIVMNVVQQIPTAVKEEGMLPRLREKRVGKAIAQFHATPKAHQRKKGRLGTFSKSRGTDEIIAEREAKQAAKTDHNPERAPAAAPGNPQKTTTDSGNEGEAA